MKPYMMHAGLAVMLMQKYKNVLPIKYIYRRGQGNSFAFEPTIRGSADKRFIRGAVYPEIIYNSDRPNTGAKKHKIDIGKIPGSWKIQKKRSKRTGEMLTYFRGGHSDNAIGGKNWYDKFQYRDYSFQARHKSDKSDIKRSFNDSASEGPWGYGPRYVNVTPKSPQDYVEGKGLHSPRNDPKYNEFTRGMQTGGIGGRRKTSQLQISPQGMKARWIRGGGPGGGQHLRDLKTPRGTRMSMGNFKGDIGRLPGQHIMAHWYRLWQANYELHLQSQAQRVLRSFVRMVYPDQGPAEIEKPKVVAGTKTVRSKRGRGGGPRGGYQTYSTKRETAMAIRKVGIQGDLEHDTFMQVLKENPYHFLGSQKTKSSWSHLFEDINMKNKNAMDWIKEVKSIERKLNRDPEARRKYPNATQLVGMPIGWHTGIIMISKPGGQPTSKVQMTAMVAPTGRFEAKRIAHSLIRKNANRQKAASQTTLESATRQKKQSVDILTQETETLFALVGNSQLSISFEDEDGAAMQVGDVMASKIFKKVNKQLRTKRKFMQQSLSAAFDPESLHMEGGFKDWYYYWLKESKRLERLTVGSNRGAWQKFMREFVGPNPDPKLNLKKKGNIADYMSASKTWHSPGYIRPFVRLGRTGGERYNEP